VPKNVKHVEAEGRNKSLRMPSITRVWIFSSGWGALQG